MAASAGSDPGTTTQPLRAEVSTKAVFHQAQALMGQSRLLSGSGSFRQAHKLGTCSAGAHHLQHSQVQ